METVDDRAAVVGAVTLALAVADAERHALARRVLEGGRAEAEQERGRQRTAGGADADDAAAAVGGGDARGGGRGRAAAQAAEGRCEQEREDGGVDTVAEDVELGGRSRTSRASESAIVPRRPLAIFEQCGQQNGLPDRRFLTAVALPHAHTHCIYPFIHPLRALL